MDKDEIYHVIHEMRQPLNVISLAAGNAKFILADFSQEQSPDKVMAKIELIERQSEILASIIDRLLDKEGMA